MADRNAVTIITDSRNLRALPFRPTEDQLSIGKCWEDWLESIEREFRYFRIDNSLDKNREYARGRRERRNRFRPADVAFFSSESDKNVALIFRKIRCFDIHFNIHTCHQLVFDLGQSSTRYRSGLHKKNRYVVENPSGKAADVFPRKNRGIH